MRIQSTLKVVFVFFIITSCKLKEHEKSMDGLWEITKVSIGEGEMTPVARWIRLNKDFTQESGNGWLQHSVGTWTLDPTNNLLGVNNSNGIEDKVPFEVNLTGNTMTWKRIEMGEEVSISLRRISKIPTSEANKLFGLWKFTSIHMDSKEISDSLNPKNKATLYLAWDHNYKLSHYPDGDKYGIFKTHGHRQRMQMVVNYNTRQPKIEFYNFEIDKDTLHLKSVNKNIQLKLIRIHQFLD